MTLQSITIRRPDDWHVHLRDGEMLKTVAPYTARQFARAIVMPNLVPPVTSVEDAAAYRDRIIAAAGPDFTPLMTCYLTDNVDPDELARGYADGVWVAAKLYPAGATTNSASGVTDIRNIYPALERMQEIGMVLLHPWRGDRPGRRRVRPGGGVHRPDPRRRWCATFPGLKIVLEHITTRQAAEFVADAPPNVAATDHAAAPAPQSQRAVPGRAAAPRLLPAGGEARGASAGGARGGGQRLAEILPRHRQRAARARGQGIGLRLRRHLQRAVCARKLCARCSRKRARWTGSKASPRNMAPASTACRSTRGR